MVSLARQRIITFSVWIRAFISDLGSGSLQRKGVFTVLDIFHMHFKRKQVLINMIV